MAGDIFYSEVDKNLQSELRARGYVGSVVKDKAALDFMTSKITNVQLSAFNSPKLNDNTLAKNSQGQVSEFSSLGGQYVRGGHYVPKDKYGRKTRIIKEEYKDGEFLDTFELVNQPRGFLTNGRLANRIPPVITLCDINIGDGSMGLLNRASVNILISDPSADLSEFEEIWFRPGRHVLLEYEGNKEQIVTRNRSLESEIAKAIAGGSTVIEGVEEAKKVIQTFGLLEEPNTRTAKIFEEKYSSEFLEARKNQIRHMNKVLFDGVLTSFTFSYQTDGTVDVNLQFSGTSNVYTDVELLLPKKEKEEGQVNKKSENTETNTLFKFIEDLVERELEAKDSGENPQICFNSQYGQQPNDNTADRSILIGTLYNEAPDVSGMNADEAAKVLKTETIQHQHRYIQLGLLIDILNKEILSKLERKDPDDPDAEPIISSARIVCDTQICKSNHYKEIVSANPKEILFYGAPSPIDAIYSRYPSDNIIIEPTKEDQEAAKKAKKKAPEAQSFSPVEMMPSVENFSSFNYFAEEGICFPSRIYIEIDKVIDPILSDPTVKTANDFLKKISEKIYSNTGGAIAMTLVTDPNVADQLIYYDRKFLGTPDSVKAVNTAPFIVPMGAKSSLEGTNTLRGTIVTDLKLTSKLPADLQSLAFTLNEGSDISSEAISPFITFMYAQGSLNEEGSQKAKIAKKYKKSHQDALRNLEEAKGLLSRDFANIQNNIRLKKALQKYIQYPTADILKSNTISAPIYPFDAELTIEGISGFKYGDVVILPLLPKRYRTQTVFSVIGVDHTIDSAGVWQTKLKLIMRPKIT